MKYWLPAALIFCALPYAWAETPREIQESLVTDKVNFEKNLSSTAPGVRAKETQRYQAEVQARSVVLQENLRGLSTDQKSQMISEYAQESQRLRAEHEKKLKSLPSDLVEQSKARQAFQKKQKERLRAYYSS